MVSIHYFTAGIARHGNNNADHYNDVDHYNNIDYYNNVDHTSDVGRTSDVDHTSDGINSSKYGLTHILYKFHISCWKSIIILVFFFILSFSNCCHRFRIWILWLDNFINSWLRVINGFIESQSIWLQSYFVYIFSAQFHSQRINFIFQYDTNIYLFWNSIKHKCKWRIKFSDSFTVTIFLSWFRNQNDPSEWNVAKKTVSACLWILVPILYNFEFWIT